MKHHELRRKTLYAAWGTPPTSGKRLQQLSSIRLSHSSALQRRRITIQGIIESVKFYAFVSALARRWDLIGFVLNTNTGAGVLIEVQGRESAIESFLDALLTKAPPLARIDAINTELLPTSSGENSFEIQRKQISD
jgi:hydrogenase maturation protein HypF